MTQGQKQPPEGPPDAAEAAPSTEPAPFTARLFLAEHPTLRERLSRRWWRLTISDWGAVALILALYVVGPHWLLRLAHRLPAPQQLLGESLTLTLAAIGGALLIYTVLRRALADTATINSQLLGLNRESIDTSRDLLSAVQGWVADAYAAGRQETLAAAATVAQSRIEELERALSAQPGSQLAVATAELRKQMTDLQATTARMQADFNSRTGDIDELSDSFSDLRAQADAIAAEIQRLDLRRQLLLDATDRQILDLLSGDPALTDEEIGRHPRVALERSQVTRRRNRLAAAGYTAAQKRQGQRPGAR